MRSALSLSMLPTALSHPTTTEAPLFIKDSAIEGFEIMCQLARTKIVSSNFLSKESIRLGAIARNRFSVLSTGTEFSKAAVDSDANEFLL